MALSRRTGKKQEAIEIVTTDEEDAELEMEDVDPTQLRVNGDDDDEEMEEVDVSADPYAAVHQQGSGDSVDRDEQKDAEASTSRASTSKAAPFSLTFDEAQQPSTPKRARNLNTVTPRDRAARLDGHKLHVLALLAHAKMRNRWLNDEDLRIQLYNMFPAPLRTKLRAIHPKRVESQRERVRMFESFLNELVRWWAARFYLNPDQAAAGAIRQPSTDLLTGAFPRRGRRVDGWAVETQRDRDERKAKEDKEKEKRRKAISAALRSAAKGKGKAKPPKIDPLPPKKPFAEVTIFPPGSDPSARPAYLRLLAPPEPIAGPSDLIAAAEARAGSRETSAQLFCSLCRSLGIPARLVMSPQVAPWSVGAGKVATSMGAVDPEERKGAGKGKKRIPQRTRTRATDDDTSDDYDFEDGLRLSRPGSTGGSLAGNESDTSKVGTRSRPVSVASDAPAAEQHEAEASGNGARIKGKGKGRDKGKDKDKADGDYRDAKWKGLSTPLEVEYRPKLRQYKPTATKETALEPQQLDVDPIDLDSPPTMWVEVFSKPFQRWITVDPIRARVSPTGNRHMEPTSSDRANKLVYVVAFEEDGYARDVTARYTKTLHSRISRMRPPGGTRKGGGGPDWWETVVSALHRPQRLERDAVEDAELEEAASKEPMPNSVGGFKDHPVYALERHLKRDEAIHPYTQIGTFSGIPVFHRRNVVALRSARQWYNEGRVVREGQEALKWVKSRGYTLASKRAEEQARAEGAEDPQEGLYAHFQTDVYVPPPVKDGIVPKNHFGNIDLFVPSMLPAGAAHIPHNGAAKVAKKLGVNYAEAIVGFEFRKHRSHPKLVGIVVPEEQEDLVLDAYWESEHLAAERELGRREERAIKGWRKLVNALRIAKRVREQYGKGEEVEEEGEQEGGSKKAAAAPGGFIAEGEDDEGDATTEPEPPIERSRLAATLDRYGTSSGRAAAAAAARVANDADNERNGSDGEASGDDDDDDEEIPNRADVQAREKEQMIVEPGGAIVSLADLAAQGRARRVTELEDAAAAASPASVKRRKIIVRSNSNSNRSGQATTAASSAASAPARGRPRRTAATPQTKRKVPPTKRRRRGRGASSSEEEATSSDDDISAPAPPASRPRSTRAAASRARTRGSLRERDDDEGEED